MSFDTQIQQISTDDLDKLFDGTPAGTPSANDLNAGSQSSDDIDKNAGLHVGNADIDYVDPASIPNADGTEDALTEEQKVAKAAADKTAADAKAAKEAADAEAAKTPEEKQAEADAKAAEEAKAAKDGEKPEQAEINAVLKNTMDYLIESGQWADFDGREDLEMTEEIYAELALKQSQQSAYEIVNELIDSTGAYGKAIIGHIKNGGNPDDVIDIFKEEQELKQIDTSTEAGKQVKIEKYYKDILGWKAEKVSKHIKRLIEDNEIDAEHAEVDELYTKHHQQQLAKIDEQAKVAKQEEVRRKEVFAGNIKKAIEANKDLTPKERQVIESSILDFKHKLDNGQKVNDFYLKFAEMQADPASYVELVQFVMDKDNYKKKIKTVEQSAANRNAFSFVKGSAAIKKATTQPVEINDKREITTRGTDFSFALNKK
jgi:hypothetical protein